MYNIASAKSLKQIAAVQKKAIRATVLAKYNAHVDPFLISNKLLQLSYKSKLQTWRHPTNNHCYSVTKLTGTQLLILAT